MIATGVLPLLESVAEVLIVMTAGGKANAEPGVKSEGERKQRSAKDLRTERHFFHGRDFEGMRKKMSRHQQTIKAKKGTDLNGSNR
jgi:hypothetical protein